MQNVKYFELPGLSDDYELITFSIFVYMIV